MGLLILIIGFVVVALVLASISAYDEYWRDYYTAQYYDNFVYKHRKSFDDDYVNIIVKDKRWVKIKNKDGFQMEMRYKDFKKIYRRLN